MTERITYGRLKVICAVSSGTVTVGGDVQNGTALPVIGDSQQVYVGK